MALLSRDTRHRVVSIPFIAGQWSLLKTIDMPALRLIGSQSPSLRGSGRFRPWTRIGPGASSKSQSPSLRGSGRFASRLHFRPACRRQSQSPSLRGSGRFGRRPTATGGARSLNPLHCGAVVASGPMTGTPTGRSSRLNPLHCGAVVASSPRRAGETRPPQVSIPFIAGQWSLPGGFPPGEDGVEVSQSPSLRGSGRFGAVATRRRSSSACLNPLHCGAVVASPGRRPPRTMRWCLNPLHCGAVVASDE